MENLEPPIPLPSHIHYELLLQLLEQQTMSVVYQNPHLRSQVQELIFTLRKAISQQRQLEAGLSGKAKFRWSISGLPIRCLINPPIKASDSNRPIWVRKFS
jgi:hypothetical protein